MTLLEALSFTGNQYNSMTYDELVEVTRAFAEAARKRISRQQQGPAYEKLKRKAIGAGKTKKVNMLNMKNGRVSISQKFKGKNKMSQSDLRSLRKALYEFLTDTTSTKKGLKEFNKKAEKQFEATVLDLGDSLKESDMTDQELLDAVVSDSELIRYGIQRLDWDSDQIYSAITASGGYSVRGSESFNSYLREYVEEELAEAKALEDEDPRFFVKKRNPSQVGFVNPQDTPFFSE